ncbi:glycoside hydrolase family protein [Porcipelethomonas sp.]|uniref:glycoside hydrolase family protein n=1 Tax=Porcipelethomonas sp. TaxID=2981675 RepID=UPI003EF2A910
MKKQLKKFLCFFLTFVMVIPVFNAEASGNMKASQECLDLIKECEGFSKYKYWDYSQWTIGYGTGVGEDEYPDGITEEEAEALLEDALTTYEGYVNKFADKYNIDLKQNQFDALVSMTYNLGNIWGVYDEFDLKTYLINGSENYSFLEIEKAFGEWRKAGGSVVQGLVNRRQKEAGLFLSDRNDYIHEVWRVNSDNGINLRKSADVNSEKTGFMSMNTIFAITEKKTSGDGTLWGKTEYDGAEHWCTLEYCKYMAGGPIGYDDDSPDPEIDPDPDPDPDPDKEEDPDITENLSENWKITAKDGVDLKSGPGLNYSKVGTLEYGTQITVNATCESDGYLWGKTVSDGKIGWCTLDFAERISEQELEGAALVSIYISSRPEKVTYIEGERLDLSGIEVKGKYSDGSEEVITDFTVSGFESVPGSHSVTITYMEKTASFRVTVEEKKLTGIKVESGPEKTVYKLGEGFSPAGLKVIGSYDNNTKSEITDYYLNNTEGFSKTPGIKTIEVEYQGFKDTFTVEVSEKSLIDIKITNNPDKTEYVLGQELNTKGLIVYAYFDNNTKNEITDYSISGYNPQYEGVQEVKVGYSGIYKTFEVNVSKPDIYELPGDIDKSGARDIFDLIMLNQYIDGKTELDEEAVYLADIDGDGQVNSKDVECLSRIVSEQ